MTPSTLPHSPTEPPRIWRTSRFDLDVQRPLVMGIVNVTPDSFSDGGQHSEASAAIQHCESLLQEGADILDIGGESSRPGASQVSQDIELARVLPVLRAAVQMGAPVSVDTYKPAVMRAALDLGVDIINDIWALRWSDGVDDAHQVVAAHPSCGVCLMHMHGNPATMQLAPMAGDAVPQVLQFLEHSTQHLQALGVQKSRIFIDPGIGFGKTPEQNFSLLAQQHVLVDTGWGVLVGWSRKSSLGTLIAPRPLAADERLGPSVVAAVLAAQRGARVLRVHDVRQTVAALKLWWQTR